MRPAHWLAIACCVGALAIGSLIDVQRDRLLEATEALDVAAEDLDRAVKQLRHNVAAALDEVGAAHRG